jgi:hypothetical protein
VCAGALPRGVRTSLVRTTGVSSDFYKMASVLAGSHGGQRTEGLTRNEGRGSKCSIQVVDGFLRRRMSPLTLTRIARGSVTEE